MAILDQWGNPFIYQKFLDAAQTSTGNRPSWPTRTESIRRSVTTYDWRTAVSASRKLFANMGIPKGAICQKAMFSVGRAWHPIFRGKNKAYGDKATEWLLNEWFPICEVRGGAFDFVTSLYVDSVTVDRDGGYGVLLTETKDGYPLTQRIPIHRWGNSLTNAGGGGIFETPITEGPYAGCTIYQGIISNAQGRPVAHRIYEDAYSLGAQNLGKFTDISADDLIHVYDPEWYDQGHGFPAFTHALNDLRDMQQSQQYEQLAMLIASSIGLIEYNETGEEDPNDPLTVLKGANPNDPADAGKNPLSAQVMEGGMVRYFKANSGSKLEAFHSDRPGEIWDNFNDRLARSALLGINWPYALVWKPEGGGTDTRADILKARSAVEDRQDLMRPVARRIIGYALSKAAKLGILPYDEEWYKWDFAMPPKMGIDDGRFSQQRRSDLVAGVETMERDALDRGTTWTATRAQREREADDLLERAQRLSDKRGVSIDAALTLLQQQNPNQQLVVAQPSDPNQP